MKILFFGELYPEVVHGISISNKTNIEILKKTQNVDLKIIKEKTSIESIGRNSFLKIFRILKQANKIRKETKNARYHFLYLTLSLSTFGLLKTKIILLSVYIKRRTKVVAHLHRGDFEKVYSKSFLNKILIDWCLKNIDTLIVLSLNQKLQTQKILPNQNIRYIENTVFEEANVQDRFQKISNKKFLYISNYIREKGIYDLIGAFNNLDHLKLDCYGEFNKNKDELLNMVKTNIAINGPILSKDKFNKLINSDALILPSYNEGQPVILLEAMLTGTIMLVTKVGLIEELLGEDYPFYIEENSEKSINDCILKFNSYDKKIELSQKLRDRYFKFYSNYIHEKKLLDIFSF